jgi:hypothetical protein
MMGFGIDGLAFGDSAWSFGHSLILRRVAVELPLFDRTLGYGVWARMNSRGERILSPECGWLSL